MLMQEKFDRMDWVTYGVEEEEKGREEERQVIEEKDRRRVWKMHEHGMSLLEIADNMEIQLDTVKKWLNGPKPAKV